MEAYFFMGMISILLLWKMKALSHETIYGLLRPKGHIKMPSQWSISCWMISAVHPVKVLSRVWNLSFCHCTLMV